MATFVFGSGLRAAREEEPPRPQPPPKPRRMYVLVVSDAWAEGAWHSHDRAALGAFARARRFDGWFIEESAPELPPLHGDGRYAHLGSLTPSYAPLGMRGGRQDASWHLRRLIESGPQTIGDLLSLPPAELAPRLALHADPWLPHWRRLAIIDALEARVREAMGEMAPELARSVAAFFRAAGRRLDRDEAA
jgi:hypothetical protein